MPEPGLLESGSVWATGGRVLMQPQAAEAGERARFRTAASGCNSDIPRDFMKVSVAATTDVPVRQSVLPRTARTRHPTNARERRLNTLK